MLTHRSCPVPFLAPSQHGWTAFHYAAENGHVAAMEFLLAHGADPKAEDKVRAPLEAYWLEKEGREGGRVQRCTRACHEWVLMGDKCPTAGVLALLGAGADRTAKDWVSAMNNKGQC